MKLKITLILIAGLLVLASPALAQQGGFEFKQSAHRLEIIPMYGYTWTVSRSGTYDGYGGEMDFKDSDFWGIALDINAKPGAQARLLYRRQDTQLTWKRPGEGTSELGDVGVEYWHIGGVGGMTKGNVMTFTSLTLGGTRYIYNDQDNWKFSIILSIGAKVYLNEKIGLMVSGQMPYTFTDMFIGVGTGGMSLGGYGIAQFDVLAGLIIML